MDLIIKLTGAVESSNLQEYKQEVMAVIDGIKTDLQTDRDFGDAEKAAKQCGTAEKAIVEAKKEALDQTKSIAELFDAMDDISSKLRETRLTLQRQIKERKQELKNEIIDIAVDELNISIKENTPHRATIKYFNVERSGFELAVKSKRTVAAMSDAVKEEATAQLEQFTEFDNLVNRNDAIMQVYIADNPSLFADLDHLLAMETDSMQEIAESRIGKFAAEQEAKGKEVGDKAEREAKKPAPPAKNDKLPDDQELLYQLVVSIEAGKDDAIRIAGVVNDACTSFGDKITSINLTIQ